MLLRVALVKTDFLPNHRFLQERNIPEDDILHSHRRENRIPYMN
jgi:hypothetical protein